MSDHPDPGRGCLGYLLFAALLVAGLLFANWCSWIDYYTGCLEREDAAPPVGYWRFLADRITGAD